MTQPSRRKRVLNLLTKARDAARRPLYTEIVLVERQRKQRRIRQRSLGSIELSNVESRRSSSHDPTYENENPDRILTWEEVCDGLNVCECLCVLRAADRLLFH